MAGAIAIISTFSVLNIDEVRIEEGGRAVVEMHTDYSRDDEEDGKKIDRALEKFDKFFGPKKIVEETASEYNGKFKAIFQKGDG